MNHDLSYYRKIQGLQGTTSAKEAEIRRIRTDYTQEFDTWLDPEDVTINGVPSKLLVVKTAKADVKKASVKPDATLSYGDIIGWLGTYWIVDELDADNRIYNKGKMRQCNLLLKWMSESGAVISRYCVFGDAAKFSDGVKQTSQITTVDSTLTIRIRTDSEVAKLKHNSRFLIGNPAFVYEMLRSGTHPPAYELTKAVPVSDTRNGAGYTDLIVKETEYSDTTDNPFLMIANYYNSNDTYAITISNTTSPLSLAVGADFELAATVTKNGNIDQSAIWWYSSDESVATVDQDGKITAVAEGSCVITAQVAAAKQKITVNVQEVSESAEIRIFIPSGETTIPFGNTLLVEFSAYENGEVVPTVFTCSISENALPVATIASTGSGFAIIRVANVEAYIGEEFLLTVSSNELSTSASVLLKIVGWF